METTQLPPKKLTLDRMTIAVLNNSRSNMLRGQQYRAAYFEQSTLPACDVTNPTTITYGLGVNLQ
jgi:hypothetical protein